MSSPEVIATKSYLATLNEDQFRNILKNFLERRCGPTRMDHSVSEHGLDIASVYKGHHDFVYQDITIMVQAKVGKISPKQLRENIFGQLSELFVREIKLQPFHPHNPRRILLIVAGELSPESRKLVENWNDKIPVPVEILELEGITELLIEEYQTLNTVKQLASGVEIPAQTPSIQTVGSEQIQSTE